MSKGLFHRLLVSGYETSTTAVAVTPFWDLSLEEVCARGGRYRRGGRTGSRPVQLGDADTHRGRRASYALWCLPLPLPTLTVVPMCVPQPAVSYSCRLSPAPIAPPAGVHSPVRLAADWLQRARRAAVVGRGFHVAVLSVGGKRGTRTASRNALCTGQPNQYPDGWRSAFAERRCRHRGYPMEAMRQSRFLQRQLPSTAGTPCQRGEYSANNRRLEVKHVRSYWLLWVWWHC